MSTTIIFGTSKSNVGWFIFLEYFSNCCLILLWSGGFTIFQSKIPRLLISSSKVVNTCQDNKRKQIVSVFKQYLENFDTKF